MSIPQATGAWPMPRACSISTSSSAGAWPVPRACSMSTPSAADAPSTSPWAGLEVAAHTQRACGRRHDVADAFELVVKAALAEVVAARRRQRRGAHLLAHTARKLLERLFVVRHLQHRAA
eukprot:312280-Chlamydomonas_euryale.AAC.3